MPSSTQEVLEAAAKVAKVILVEGTSSEHHRAELRRLRQSWPGLYHAVMDLTSVSTRYIGLTENQG